jgi:methionine biosynthesis protein MetW
LAVDYLPEDAREILDVGCGTGTMARCLEKRGVLVDGITWNAAEAEQAATACRKVMQCNLERGIPDVESSAYDVVVCSHILEHIAYPQQLLTDIFAALRPGAILIVVIPNIFFWRDRLKLLKGHWRYEPSGTFDYTHLRWYTVETMQDLLISSGFTITQFKSYGWIPLPLVRLIVGQSARRWINDKACEFFPGLFGQQLLFCARK